MDPRYFAKKPLRVREIGKVGILAARWAPDNLGNQAPSFCLHLEDAAKAVSVCTSRTLTGDGHHELGLLVDFVTMAPKVDFRPWHEPPPDYGMPETLPTVLRVIGVGVS